MIESLGAQAKGIGDRLIQDANRNIWDADTLAKREARRAERLAQAVEPIAKPNAMSIMKIALAQYPKLIREALERQQKSDGKP